MTTAPTIQTPQDFAQALLVGVGAPTTPSNVQTITDWERAEGGNWANSAAFNPLNTTLKLPGSTVMPGGGAGAAAGVQAYGSWAQGLQATISTLLEKPYSAVVADLRASAPEKQTAADVAASPWGTGNFAPGGSPSSSPPTNATLAGDAYPGGSWDPLNWLNNALGPLGGAFGLAGPSGGSGGSSSAPGGSLNPINWPGEAAGAVGAGITGALKTIAKPLAGFVENAALVLLGIVAIIVGLVVLAKAAGNAPSARPAGATGGSAAPPADEAAEAAL